MQFNNLPNRYEKHISKLLVICYIYLCTGNFWAPLLVIWITQPKFYGGHLWITARLAGGVNLNYIRLDSPDHHQSIDGDHLIVSITGSGINGIAQGEFEAPTQLSDGFRLPTGKKLTGVHPSSNLHSPLLVVHSSLKPAIYLARQFQWWQYQANIYSHIKLLKGGSRI